MDLGSGIVIAEPQVDLSTLQIHPRERYQRGVSTIDVFPRREDGTCATGCGRAILGRRRRWCSDRCNDAALRAMSILHSYGEDIGIYLGRLFGEKCAGCGRAGYFETDHIIEIADGGGGKWLHNFRLLCHRCHVLKTTASRRART